MTRTGVVVLVALLGLAAASPVGSAHAQPAPGTDNSVTRISVAENGTATWTVRIRTRLPTGEDVADFERFQERFRENTSRYLSPFRERIRRTVGAAANATGREMRVYGFDASTSVQTVPRQWGVVTYRFTWSGFAARDGDRLVVGDVFDGGFYLSENDTLAVSAPPSRGIDSASPDPDAIEDGTARWAGPQDFPDERPRLAFAAVGSPAAGTDDSPAGPGDDGGDGSGIVLPILALLVGLGAAGGAVIYRIRDRSTSGSAEPAPEPKPDEERVLDLLRESGGQLKQSAVVDRLGWSKSKTSRVLSRMAEEGDVEKIRIGRENVVRLPESDD